MEGVARDQRATPAGQHRPDPDRPPAPAACRRAPEAGRGTVRRN